MDFKIFRNILLIGVLYFYAIDLASTTIRLAVYETFIANGVNPIINFWINLSAEILAVVLLTSLLLGVLQKIYTEKIDAPHTNKALLLLVVTNVCLGLIQAALPFLVFATTNEDAYKQSSDAYGEFLVYNSFYYMLFLYWKVAKTILIAALTYRRIKT